MDWSKFTPSWKIISALAIFGVLVFLFRKYFITEYTETTDTNTGSVSVRHTFFGWKGIDANLTQQEIEKEVEQELGIS